MLGYTKTEQTGRFRFSPPEIIKALGVFDLDPCTSILRPWGTAIKHYTEEDNGLLLSWFGRVWMNPPWDDLTPWIEKMKEHRNGISLLPGRTYLPVFHSHVFPHADSMLIMEGRPYFYDEDGVRAKGHCGTATVLVAYGEQNSDSLADSEIKGHHQMMNQVSVIVIGIDKSWRSIISSVLVNLNEPVSVDRVYKEVEKIAPDKVKGNVYYKEKIRQILQTNFKKVQRGVYEIVA